MSLFFYFGASFGNISARQSDGSLWKRGAEKARARRGWEWRLRFSGFLLGGESSVWAGGRPMAAAVKKKRKKGDSPVPLTRGQSAISRSDDARDGCEGPDPARLLATFASEPNAPPIVRTNRLEE